MRYAFYSIVPMEYSMAGTFAQTAALSRIAALAYCFDNADAPAMEDAAANLANGCPAFWHRAAGGNAVVGGFIAILNRCQDVGRAARAVEAEFGACRMREPRFLDAVLPLNRAAAKSLAAAYEESTVAHPMHELLARTDTAEDEALAALEQLRRSGAPHPLIGALGGLDPARVEAAVEATTRKEPAAAA
jgi:hypothetical protein